VQLYHTCWAKSVASRAPWQKSRRWGRRCRHAVGEYGRWLVLLTGILRRERRASRRMHLVAAPESAKCWELTAIDKMMPRIIQHGWVHLIDASEAAGATMRSPRHDTVALELSSVDIVIFLHAMWQLAESQNRADAWLQIQERKHWPNRLLPINYMAKK